MPNSSAAASSSPTRCVSPLPAELAAACLAGVAALGVGLGWSPAGVRTWNSDGDEVGAGGWDVGAGMTVTTGFAAGAAGRDVFAGEGCGRGFGLLVAARVGEAVAKGGGGRTEDGDGDGWEAGLGFAVGDALGDGLGVAAAADAGPTRRVGIKTTPRTDSSSG